MKKLIFTVTALATILFFANFYMPSNSNGEASSNETRDVSGFTGINLSIPATANITQGSPFKVVLDGDVDDLEKIVTKVENGKLIIKLENWSSKLNSEVNVHITLPKLESLNVSGSGSIISEKSLDVGDIDLKVSGSGKIKINDLKATEIQSDISGSGKIEITGPGSAGNHNISISGSGNIEAKGLTTGTCDINISGSGKATVDCDTKITAKISGSGRIYYSGDAKIDAMVSGSGKVVEL